jgi:VanZ family protein
MLPRILWRILAVLVLLTLFLAPLPGLSGPIWRELENAAHVVIFAVLAPTLLLWLHSTRLLGRRPGWIIAACAWGLAVLLGLAIEVLQSFGPRDASWEDLSADALGAAAGVLALFAWEQRTRRRYAGWAACASLAFVIIGCWPLGQQFAAQWEARRALPVLLGDTTSRALFNTERRSAVIERAAPHWRIRFQNQLPWPGITFEAWPPDWRRYRALVLDLQNPNPTAVEIGVVVRDAMDSNEYNNRFNTAFPLPAGAHRAISLSLQQVMQTPGGRQLDLGAIQSVSIFRNQGAGETLLIHEIRLE